jgi:hypothetical protein
VEAFTSVCGSFAFNIRICPCDHARKNIPLGRKESDNVRQKLELKTNYQDGQLTRLQYVKRMAFKVLPVS